MTLTLERSERPRPYASPTASFPMALDGSATSTLARRTMALACRQCRTQESLRAYCDKLTCTARSGLLSLASHWTAPLHSSLPPSLPCPLAGLVLEHVDFQRVGTLRHSDLCGENILGNEATTEFSLISFPFAEREM